MVDRRRPPATVPAGGALVEKEAGVVAGGLKHLTHDDCVFRGGLLVRTNVCIIVLPHLIRVVGLLAIE